jgi:hypothetical protein
MGVAMPEIPINENRQAAGSDDEVGFAVNIPRVQAIPNAARVKFMSEEKLGPGVLALDGRHHP